MANMRPNSLQEKSKKLASNFCSQSQERAAMKQNLAASAATTRRSHHGKVSRSARVVGLGITAGALLAVGMIASATAPQAHADIEDLFQPVIDAIAQAVTVADPGLLNSLDSSLDASSIAVPALAAAATEN